MSVFMNIKIDRILINSYGTLHCWHCNLGPHLHSIFRSSNLIIFPLIPKPPKLLFLLSFFDQNSECISHFLYRMPAAKWGALLFRVLEVPGSNFGPDMVILTDVFRGFPHCLQTNVGLILRPSTLFLIRYMMIILPFGAVPVV